MSLVSMEFLLFVMAAAAGYYLIPKKYQWVWLLGFSYFYYVSGGIKMTLFLLFSTLTTYCGGRLLEAEERKQRKKWILIGVLILNFGMLGVLKYTNFAVHTINNVFHTEYKDFVFLLPLGISFYTFQAMGYLLDVYWGRCKAEKSPWKFALFLSFFPQLLQGPIGRYSRLAEQLYEPHKFNGKEVERGIRRILWGYFKKMVIADNAVIFVDAIFNQPQTYNGLSIIGVLAYSIQLYCDFSGGIDVVLGIAQLFGIHLDENFKRPYFAVSITDFWHRWHITLGTWMKDYVFYPVSLSRWMNRFSKFAKKVFGKQIGRTLPICVANLIVFFVVGVWHGAAWKYIAYGMYNGLMIAFSGLMAQNYRKWKSALHINDKSKGFHLFQIIRTFLLVNISWFFDRGADIHTALVMMKNAVTHFEIGQILNIPVGNSGGTAYTLLSLAIILAGCLAVFLVSVLEERREERGIEAGKTGVRCPFAVRLAGYVVILMMIPAFGQPSAAAGGFIYAQF